MTLIAVFAAIIVATVLWQSTQLSSFGAVATHVDAMKPWATGVRLCAIAALAFAWPKFSPGNAPSGGDDIATHARWIALRWRVIGWLLVIELLLGQGLFRAVVASLAESP
jgi:hypothetical protein